MMNQQKAGSPRDGGGDDRVIFVTHESTYQQFAFDVPDEQGLEFVPVFSSACVPAHPALGVDAPDKSRLLTDRAAYLSFLEVQLERVSTSCLTVQGFSGRIEELQSQIMTMEVSESGAACVGC